MPLSAVHPEAAAGYLDQAPDAIIAVDRSGTIVLANTSAAALFGYDQTELVGQPIELLVPADLAMSHRAHRTRYGAAPTVRQMGEPGARLSARHADGTEIPVEIALSPVTVGDTQTTMAVIRDQRARLEAEAEHESIRQSLDAVEEAVFMFDPETLVFNYANAGAIAHTGYSSDELVGDMTPLHIQPDFNDASFRRLMTPLVEEHMHAVTFTTVHRTKDGRDVPVEVNLSYPPATTGVARRMVALARDITERKASEDRLRDSERAFRSAFDDAPVPMAIVDRSAADHGRIIEANQAMADMFGFDTSTLARMTMPELTHPDDRGQDHRTTSDRARSATTEHHAVKRYLSADGSYRWGALHAAQISGPGDAPRSIAHIIDMTRQVDAEAERDRRTTILMALGSIRREALLEAPANTVLQLITEISAESLGARDCLIATTEPAGTPKVLTSTNALGLAPRSQEHTSELGPDPVVIEDASDLLAFTGDNGRQLGQTIAVPFGASDGQRAVFFATRDAGDDRFEDADLTTATALAAEAEVTLMLDRARSERRRLFLVEDRERIARDLHDHVIQRLFAAGMSLQAAISAPDTLRERVSHTVTELDSTIASIRQTIFKLTDPGDTTTAEVVELVERHRRSDRADINLELTGDVDLVSAEIGTQLLGTLSELLTNVERHAQAATVTVTLDLADDQLTLEVADDGVGFDPRTTGGLGLRNVQQRAEALEGALDITAETNGGTRIRWSVPVTG